MTSNDSSSSMIISETLVWKRSTKGTHMFAYTDDAGREWTFYLPRGAFRNVRNVEGCKLALEISEVAE